MGLNEDVFHALNGAGNPVLDPIMIALGVAGLFAVTLLWALPLWLRRRHRDAVDLLAILVLADVIVFLLKWGLAVDRPELGVRLPVPFDDPSDPSFPSGHSTRAFVLAAFLSIRTRDWRVSAPLFTYASLMAVSRVYVGVHWPSDVFVGAVLGIALALGFDRLSRAPAYAAWRDAIVKRLRSVRSPA